MKINTLKERLYAKLKVDIMEGRLSGKFQPEPEFAAQLNVSRNTLRSVYRLLEADGLIMRHSGTGTQTVDAGEFGRKRYLFAYATRPRHYTINHIMHSICRGIEQALPLGYELETCPLEHLAGLGPQEATTILKARNICGLILNAANFNGSEPIIGLLKELAIPSVLAYCHPNDAAITGLPAISQNTRNAWKAGLEYLHSLGHRNVVTINSPSALIHEEFSPEEYSRLLKNIGLNSDPALILRTQLDESEIFHAISGIKLKFTAMICYSDFFVPPVYLALKKLLLRVPEDVSVLGYCGAGGGAYLFPPLSTVEIDYCDIGTQSVQFLTHAKEWFGLPSGKVPHNPVKFQIIVRASSAPISQTDHQPQRRN